LPRWGHAHRTRVTTPARTLLDLASSLPRRSLERALDQAEILELFDLRQLDYRQVTAAPVEVAATIRSSA
jgi:hypothetical protein